MIALQEKPVAPYLLNGEPPRYDGLKVTREQYLDLTEDGYKYDMIDGVLHMSPSAFFEHNYIRDNFLENFRSFLSKSRLGIAVSETDVLLPDGDDVLRPDVSVILTENRHIIMGHIHGVPDIVAEVLSDSTAKRDVGVKAQRYLSNGVKEYWLIDPRNHNLELWLNRGEDWQKLTGETLESRLLKGFTVTKNAIFEI